MPIKNNQLEKEAWIVNAVTNAPAAAAGQGAFYPKDVSGIAEGFYVDDQGNEIQLTSNGSINVPGGGEANTASNQGAGPGLIFKQKTGSDLELRTIAGAAGGNITVAVVGDVIELSTPSATGETNTASNAGAGNQVFKQKTGVDLEFRTLVAGTNVTMVSSTDTITINAAGGGGSSLQVQDEGSLIDSAVTTLNFTGSGVTAAQTSPGVVQIAVAGGGSGEVNTASNLGAGEGIFSLKSGVDLQLKSIVAGTNVFLASDANTITINATGGGGATIDDTAYPTGWDGDTTQGASRNAIFDKIDSMDTLISANTSKVSASGSISTHSDVSLAGAVDGHVLIRTAGVWTSTALAGGGDMLSTNNLSDVANATTALSNINGLDKTDIVSQPEAEAGTATTARAWTAQRVKQAIDALAVGGGSALEVEDEGSSLSTAVTKFNFVGAGVTVTEPVANEMLVTIPSGGGSGLAEEFSFTLSASGTIAGRTITGLPSGWEVRDGSGGAVTGSGSAASIDAELSGSADDIVFVHGASKDAVEISVLRIDTSTPFGGSGRIYLDSFGGANDAIKTNTASSQSRLKSFQSVVGNFQAKIYIRLV